MGESRRISAMWTSARHPRAGGGGHGDSESHRVNGTGDASVEPSGSCASKHHLQSTAAAVYSECGRRGRGHALVTFSSSGEVAVLRGRKPVAKYKEWDTF